MTIDIWVFGGSWEIYKYIVLFILLKNGKTPCLLLYSVITCITQYTQYTLAKISHTLLILFPARTKKFIIRANACLAWFNVLTYSPIRFFLSCSLMDFNFWQASFCCDVATCTDRHTHTAYYVMMCILFMGRDFIDSSIEAAYRQCATMRQCACVLRRMSKWEFPASTAFIFIRMWDCHRIDIDKF